MNPPIRLGDLLIKAGVVSDAQLNAALNEQRQWGGRLGAILVRMGALSEDLLVKALSRQLNIPRAAIGPTDPIVVPAQILERIDRATCEKGLLLPVQYVQERRALQVAVADPFNVVAIDDLTRRVGLRIETLIAGETQLLQAIGRVFGGAGGIEGNVGGAETGFGFVSNSGASMSQPPVMAAQQQTQPPQIMAPPSMTPQPAMTQPPQQVQQQQQQQPQAQAGDDLRVLAEQQLRAVRALVELLVERGVVTRAELAAWMAR
ncbi:MAG: hypothetical protein Q8O67_07855 [Deltaproteobacteria bacterium]|nr:hypothetical protein [Deltaproteobacteria bacterium]